MYLRNLLRQRIFYGAMFSEDAHALKGITHNDHMNMALCASAICRVFVCAAVVGVLMALIPKASISVSIRVRKKSIPISKNAIGRAACLWAAAKRPNRQTACGNIIISAPSMRANIIRIGTSSLI